MPKPPMPRESHHYLDRSGTLAAGAFFRFYEAVGDDSYGQPVDGMVLSLRSPTKPELKRSGERYLTVNTTDVRVEGDRRCPKYSDHVTEQEVVGVRYRVSNRGRLADLIYNEAAAWVHTIVSGAFAAKLKASGLNGYKLSEAEPERPKDAITGVELWVFNFTGLDCRRPASIRHAPNACPHCGNAPLVCPSCGYVANPCPRCEELAIVPRGLHTGAGDKRLISDEPKGFVPRILDGVRWDGSDFIYPNFITKRALDWLLSIHAAPFFAEPVLVCVDAMTDKQRKKLEAAKRPVGG